MYSRIVRSLLALRRAVSIKARRWGLSVRRAADRRPALKAVVRRLSTPAFRRFGRVIRRYVGVLIGALIGLVGGLGLFGVVLGGVIGFLVDELRSRQQDWRAVDRFYRSGDPESMDGRTVWLAGVTALAGSVLAAGRPGRSIPRVGRALIRRRVVDTFDLPNFEGELLEHMVDRFFLTDRPAVEGVCGALKDVIPDAASREVVVLALYRVAPGVGERISDDQDALIRSFARLLELSEERFNVLRRASVPSDDEAYRILGVSEETDTEEIRRVYRRLAAQFHPDAGSELDGEQLRQTEEAFIRIQNAYQRVMSDRSGRSRIDGSQRGDRT